MSKFNNKLILALCLLSLASIFILFEIKFHVENVKRELMEVNRQLIEEEEALHVLQAEWSHLNQPARLAALAAKYLNLDENSNDNLLVVENSDVKLKEILEVAILAEDDQLLHAISKNASKPQLQLIGGKKWRFKNDKFLALKSNKVMNVSVRK